MLDLVDWPERIAELRERVVASRNRGDRGAVVRAEAEVRAAPERAISFDERGNATVHARERPYRGGRFETPRIGELRTRASRGHGHARLFVVCGTDPVTDIGAMQATAPAGSLFQVASQFNCLEAPGAFLTDVGRYFDDPTQGPRASISAFPGTLVRHYAAPAADGGRFVQTTDRQVNLLADVCDPRVARVQSGYLRADAIADPAALARALDERFDDVRVGVHDEVEVVLGYDWAGCVDGERTIAQVFTSTVAGGMYGALGDESICRSLLRAAYLGTLLAAAGLRKAYAGLTLIGGGVFGNPIPLIWDAILWAFDQIEPALHRDLTVVVNGRTLDREIPPDELRGAARARSGDFIRA
jgi:hypothetical protein